MKTIIALLSFIIFAAGTLASQGTIKGNIKTKSVIAGVETIDPLESAEVFVEYGGRRISAQTNNLGDYTIKPLEPGTYNVTIVSLYIDTIVVPDIRVSAGQIAFVQDMVANYGRTLTGFTVISNTSLKNESPSKHEIKKGDLDKYADMKNLNTLIGTMGGTYVSEDGRSISFRGARIGDALYIVDGVRQRGTNVSLPNGAIASINAWYGGIPAEYGDFMGGVVVIETMTYFDWENQEEVKRLIKRKSEDREAFQMVIEKKENSEQVPPAEELTE